LTTATDTRIGRYRLMALIAAGADLRRMMAEMLGSN